MCTCRLRGDNLKPDIPREGWKWLIIKNNKKMKKEKFTGKLNLNKQMVAKLNNDQMSMINGGLALVSVRTYTCVYGPAPTTAPDCVTLACAAPNQTIICEFTLGQGC